MDGALSGLSEGEIRQMPVIDVDSVSGDEESESESENIESRDVDSLDEDFGSDSYDEFEDDPENIAATPRPDEWASGVSGE